MHLMMHLRKNPTNREYRLPTLIESSSTSPPLLQSLFHRMATWLAGLPLYHAPVIFNPVNDSFVSLSNALHPLDNPVCDPHAQICSIITKLTFSLNPQGLVVYFTWIYFKYLFKQDVLHRCRITRYTSNETVPKSVSYYSTSWQLHSFPTSKPPGCCSFL